MAQINHTGKQLIASAGRSQYDTEAINLLKDKQYLAWILKECTTEFAEMGLNEIIPYIETPYVGDIPVEPGLTNTVISGEVADSKVPGEGVISYDIRFSARLPKAALQEQKAISIRLLVDVELQRKENPGYSLISRGVLYIGRMLSEQMDRNVTGKDYDSLQKVYSIWICMNSAAERANTISRYRIAHEFLHGSYPNPEETDLVHLVVIRLPKENSAQKPHNQPTDFMKLFSTLFSEQMTGAEKIESISEYGITVTADMIERVNTMCNLSLAILERGQEEGRREGLEEGRREGLEEGLEAGREEGRREGVLSELIALVKEGLITAQIAAGRIGVTEEEFRKMLANSPQ